MRKLVGIISFAALLIPTGVSAQSGSLDRARKRSEEMSERAEEVDDMAIESSSEELVPAEPALDDGGTILFDNQDGGAGLGVPDEYIIQSGDTLWDVCARILGDPFQWPKLWSFNQYITNPHWIYPGNVLRFVEGTETAPPRFEVTKPDAPIEPSEPSEPLEPVADDIGDDPFAGTPVASEPINVDDFKDLRPKSFDIRLRQEGFIAESKISPLGKVHRAEKPVRNLAEGDELYLKFKDPGSARVGTRYTVYRQIRRVRHPVKRSYVGYLIRILGEVTIVETSERVATARIVTSYDYIKRGDPLTEFVTMVKTVNMKPNNVQLEGHIIETMADGVTLIGDRDVIYIDRGAQDGVQIGNKLQVIRKGDQLIGTRTGLPEEVVGLLVIVGTRANTSTAVVTEAKAALKLGDRVQMR